MPEVRYWNDERARQALMEQGRAALTAVRAQLDGQTGVVAIEPESGNWFVGETLGQL